MNHAKPFIWGKTLRIENPEYLQLVPLNPLAVLGLWRVRPSLDGPLDFVHGPELVNTVCRQS